MAKEINKRLQNFLDKNPQFKGEFVGYKESRGGLGISRTDDDWYECEDYLIPIDELIECLTESSKIDLSADYAKCKRRNDMEDNELFGEMIAKR